MPVTRFPVSCRLSAVGLRFLGHPAPAGELRLPHGRPTGVDLPDPNGVVVLHMSKTRPGRAPPLPRGRWCAPGRRLSSGRHLPLRCGQSLRPAGTSHRRGSPSRGVIKGSLTFAHHPKTAGCRPGAGKRHRFPPVFSSPAAPGWNESRFGFYPGLRTPRLPATHAEAETGHRALTRVLHLRHQPNLQTVPPTSLMHPHFAPSRRLLPAPPRGRRQPPRAAAPTRPDR